MYKSLERKIFVQTPAVQSLAVVKPIAKISNSPRKCSNLDSDSRKHFYTWNDWDLSAVEPKNCLASYPIIRFERNNWPCDAGYFWISLLINAVFEIAALSESIQMQ